jgi:hypothetical protein
MFDDGAGPPQVEKQSRVLGLRVDLTHQRADVAFSWGHSPPILSNFEGDAQMLPGGDYFVCWGEDPHFTEFNSRGRMIFDAHYVASVWQYRAFRMRWNGTPTTAPSVAASTRGGTTTVYASWNGATSVAAWRVLAGSSPGRLGTVKTAGRAGFETAIPILASPYVAVVPLDGHGRTIGKQSRAVRG